MVHMGNGIETALQLIKEIKMKVFIEETAFNALKKKDQKKLREIIESMRVHRVNYNHRDMYGFDSPVSLMETRENLEICTVSSFDNDKLQETYKKSEEERELAELRSMKQSLQSVKDSL